MTFSLFRVGLGKGTAILCSGFFLVYVTYKILCKKSNAQKPLPPGPSGIPALKQMMTSMVRGDLHLTAENWAKEYGEVVLCKTPVVNICFLNSAIATRKAYTDPKCKSVTNERPKTFIGWFINDYNDVITGSEGLRKTWAVERKLFHSALKFYGDGVDRFESAVQKELQRLNEALLTHANGSAKSNHGPKALLTRANGLAKSNHWEKDCQETELEGMLYYSLISVICVLMTGECPTPDDAMVKTIEALSHAINEMSNPATDKTLSMFPFLRFIPGTSYKRMCDEAIRTREVMFQQVYISKKDGYIPGQPRGIIDVLRDEQSKEGNEWMTEEHICALIIDIIIAGILTSINTLRSILLLLVYHPEAVKKIQSEIEEKIGQRQTTFRDRKALNYTEAVILETLRFASFIPLGIPHENREEFELSGFSIPKNSLLFSNNWFFHRDPKIWGDPENFRPERFLDESGNVLPTTHPLQQSLLPFGVGARVCPGENFGRTRVFLYLTNILQKFDLLPPVKHKLPPFSLNLWKNNGNILEAEKTYVILKEKSK